MANNPTDQFAERPLPPKSTSGLFSERPLPSAPPESLPAGPSIADGGRPMRWIVPLILFVVIVGGIAWLVQNMRNWRPSKTTTAAPVTADLFEFPIFYSHWEKPPEQSIDKNSDPVIYAPFTYDATNLIIAAMQAAGSSDPAKYLPELAKIKYDGASGHIEFDAKGDRKDAEMTIFTMKGGAVVPVAIIKSGKSIKYEDFVAGGAPK